MCDKKRSISYIPQLFCCLQAIDAGLPLPPDPTDMSDVKLKTNQSMFDTLVSEEAAANAKLNTDLDDNLGNEERRQLCDKMREHMVCFKLEIYTFASADLT